MLNGFGDPSAAIAQVKAANPHAVVHFCPADLSSAAGAEELVAEAQKQFGGVDVLVNNAGVQFTAPVEDFPVHEWDRVVAINLSSAFHTARLCLPRMKQRRAGRIINIASVHGHVGSTQKAAYVAAKHGIIGLTKVIGLECAPFGVAASAVCPGWVRTPLVEAQVAKRAKESGKTEEEEAERLVGEKMPSKQFVEVKHLGQTVNFLCSDAAGQINGTSIVMDGGWISQ
jgi:3-hydroxybutyrate dehydrogenase